MVFTGVSVIATGRVETRFLIVLVALAFACFGLTGWLGRMVNPGLRRLPMKHLTLEDIAILASTRQGDDAIPKDTAANLRGFVQDHPMFQESLRRLEQRADAAGLPADNPDRLHDALTLERQLGQLLAAEAWEDPAEVLDPQLEAGVDILSLMKLAEALQGEDPRMAALVTRLDPAVARECSDRALRDRFLKGLRKRHPLTAQRLLREIIAELMESAGGKTDRNK